LRAEQVGTNDGRFDKLADDGTLDAGGHIHGNALQERGYAADAEAHRLDQAAGGIERDKWNGQFYDSKDKDWELKAASRLAQNDKWKGFGDADSNYRLGQTTGLGARETAYREGGGSERQFLTTEEAEQAEKNGLFGPDGLRPETMAALRANGGGYFDLNMDQSGHATNYTARTGGQAFDSNSFSQDKAASYDGGVRATEQYVRQATSIGANEYGWGEKPRNTQLAGIWDQAEEIVTRSEDTLARYGTADKLHEDIENSSLQGHIGLGKEEVLGVLNVGVSASKSFSDVDIGERKINSLHGALMYMHDLSDAAAQRDLTAEGVSPTDPAYHERRREMAAGYYSEALDGMYGDTRAEGMQAGRSQGNDLNVHVPPEAGPHWTGGDHENLVAAANGRQGTGGGGGPGAGLSGGQGGHFKPFDFSSVEMEK